MIKLVLYFLLIDSIYQIYDCIQNKNYPYLLIQVIGLLFLLGGIIFYNKIEDKQKNE